MRTIEKVEIKKLSFTVSGYKYNAQIWRSTDGGRSFCYCGDGRYFKTLPEAETYKKEIENA